MAIFRFEDYFFLKDIEDEWDHLVLSSKCPTIFGTFSWQKIWWDCFGERDGKKLSIFFDKPADEKLTTIVAFVGNDSKWELLGSKDLFDYRDIPVTQPNNNPKEILEKILCSLGANEISFPSVQMDSPSIRQLEEVSGILGMKYECVQEGVCPIIDLPSSWDEYLATLKKKERHEIRRKLARVFENSGAKITFSGGNSNDIYNSIKTFFELLANAEEEKARFFDSRRKKFFSKIIFFLHRKGYGRILFLEVGGKKIGGLLFMDFGSSRFAYNSGFDPEFAFLSPGIVLFSLCIKDAIEKGQKKFDFLRGEEKYKFKFNAIPKPIYEIKLNLPC